MRRPSWPEYDDSGGFHESGETLDGRKQSDGGRVLPSAQLKWQIEAVLFASSEPVSAKRLALALGVPEDVVLQAIDELRARYEAGSGVVLKQVAGGYQLFTKPEYAAVVSRVVSGKRLTLSRGALETLAVIAYNQPITRSEIEALRGVNCQASLEVLLEKGLIEEVGRKKALGRPILYGTTDEFLKALGLSSLKDLPPLESSMSEPGPDDPGSGGTLFPTLSRRN